MIIDISRELKKGMAVWPGDTAYDLDQTMSIGRGESVNLTTLTMSAHSGSHVDAPLHFTAAGKAIDELDLQPYWGAAQVVTVDKQSGPLLPQDFAAYDLGRAPRLLVRSLDEDRTPDLFPDHFIYPSPELADYLGRLGIILYGTDAPSMDAADSKELPGHKAMQRNQIAILEWLNLSPAPDGIYELAAFPLKISGGDGSPVRAVLKSIPLV